jgi:hypothetical protein
MIIVYFFVLKKLSKTLTSVYFVCIINSVGGLYDEDKRFDKPVREKWLEVYKAWLQSRCLQ